MQQPQVVSAEQFDGVGHLQVIESTTTVFLYVRLWRHL